MAGMLYGSKQGFSSELMDYFSRTGVTHIIAVSGFNISIIALILMNVCVYAGLYRRQAFWLVIFFIVLFVIFTGGSASAVRAAVMGSIVLYAEKSGRTALIGYLLVYTATLMMIMNPYVLFWDAGFQLSFLATLGLVYVSPVLKTWFIFKKIPVFLSAFLDNFVSTLSAIIATLPFILFQFGTLSVVAPVVNMLVLWIIPWLMLCGFVALVVGVVFAPLGHAVAFVGHVGMVYVLMVVEWFGSNQWSAWSLSFPWWLMVVVYIVMIQWVRIHLKRTTSYV
jgi:competence protein ComEC